MALRKQLKATPRLHAYSMYGVEEWYQNFKVVLAKERMEEMSKGDKCGKGGNGKWKKGDRVADAGIDMGPRSLSWPSIAIDSESDPEALCALSRST